MVENAVVRTIEEVGIIILVRVKLEQALDLSDGEITRSHTLSLQLVLNHLTEQHTGLQEHEEARALGTPDIVRNADCKIALSQGQEGLLLLGELGLLAIRLIIRDIVVRDLVVRDAGAVLLVLQKGSKRQRISGWNSRTFEDK